jgi:hypothetical protein
MTHLAVFHFMLQRNDGIAESLHRRRILTQQMKHQSHGRFPAYTRQFGKLIHRFFQQCRGILSIHTLNSSIGGQR